MRDYLFDGSILADQPLAHSPPDHKGKNNVAQLATMMVIENGTASTRCLINDSALRGKLRRAASDVLFEKIDAKISFTTAVEWRVGGAKSSATVDSNPNLRAQVKRDNIQLAIFGAGSSRVGFLDGKLSIDKLIAPVNFEPPVISSARRAEERSEDLQAMLTPEGQEQLIAWAAANTARSRAKARFELADRKVASLRGRGNQKDTEYKAAEIEAASAKAELANYEAAANALFGDVSIGMPLPGYQVMPQGILFRLKMRLFQATEVEAGLFLAAWERFSFNPFIGGHRANGCGQISGEFRVMVREGFTQYESLGKFTFNAMDGFTGDADIRRLIAAFRSADITYDHVKGAA